MTKLTSIQKLQSANAKGWLGVLGMRVFFSRDLKMMVGIMPDDGMDNGLIYRTYVILCHPNDDFKKKLGLIYLGEAYDNNNFNRVRVFNSDVGAFVFDYMQLSAISSYNQFDFEEMELN